MHDNMKLIFTLFATLILPFSLFAGGKNSWRVYDARTRDAIPFANVRFDNGQYGTVAGLNGEFDVPDAINGSPIHSIEVSAAGFAPLRIALPAASHDVLLLLASKSLKEVVITPPYDKMRRIIDNAIANKDRNNPDRYDWYRCHVYYKMLADVSIPDSLLNDTSKDGRESKDFLDKQHLLMSETYSIRTWERPQQLQEQIVASRFSGLKRSVFTSLVTNVLPFHAYSNYLTLNGKDYHNPVSKGFERYYKFNLSSELIDGKDTVWALSFTPRGHNANDLKGTVYINSDGYAISHIIAKAKDTVLKMDVRIEQQYTRVRYGDSSDRWFPAQLNYVVDWTQTVQKKTSVTYHLKGNSQLDSVTWKPDEDFRFDKAHTVQMEVGAGERNDSVWQQLRPTPLDSKELRTYHVIDSLGEKIHADNYMVYVYKLPEGKVPIGPLDMDITRLFAYNAYEHTRLGMGLQTNERIIKWLSVGGWGGYGFGDKAWKYGAFAEVYADKTKEFVIRVGYEDNIYDPGRVKLNRDLDKNYINTYLLQRVDEIRTTYGSIRKRFNYWNIEFSGRQQDITPMYRYALDNGSELLRTFTSTEASLNLRYAYAERTAPMMGHYYSLGSRFPIWYGKLTTGVLGSDEDANVHIPYTQATTALLWHKHINRLGFEHILIEAGKSWSSQTLPLSKLFAGNGFKYDSKGLLQESLYSFGGMMTIYPYEIYADQFVNVIIRHDIDWKLYKVGTSDLPFSSAPNICLQYDLLYGTMAHPERQEYVSFYVPANGYNEVGMLLNNIIRYKYLNLYYLTFNMGYFYPLQSTYGSQSGRLTMGLGFEF
jgi:Family of unknown function (DUF5686)